MKKITILLISLLLLGAACGDGDDAASPNDTVTSDDPTTTTTLPPNRTEPGPAFVDSVELLLMESYPVQVMAVVEGTLPNPCHTLTWEHSEPDTDGRITLDIISLFDPNEECIEMIEEFAENIPVGAFESGGYILVVNGTEYPFTI